MDALATTSRAQTFPGLDFTDLEFAIPGSTGETPKPAADPAAAETDTSELALEAARFTARTAVEDGAEEEAFSDKIGSDADDEFSLAGEDEASVAMESEELSAEDEGALHREDAPLELEDGTSEDSNPDLEELDLEAELERELQPLEPALEPLSAQGDLEGGIAPDLETVELELTLQHEDLVKLTFEDSLKAALDRLGGKLLFDMRLDNVDNCQRVAAVRLGDGAEKQFALVIMPPSGGPVRVEPTTESDNPLAAIAESYDGVLSALKMAA
ncbi:MAG TPA: hypothetical protein VMF90_02660 [Rhizobiaceae bacterium]|nr:hypothetical protein [Rhizobiaceae bacterium]